MRQMRQGWPRPRPLPLLPFLPLLLSSCELTETTVPQGERIVIVQSVISRTRSDQTVMVEYSLTGSMRGPTATPNPPQSPRNPIGGATVTIEYRGPSPCAGIVQTLVERPPVTEGQSVSGLYAWNASCGLVPGDTLRLRVETPAGEVVTGSTVIPGASRAGLTVGGIALAPFDEAVMDRSTDTLRVDYEAAFGRAMQFELRNAENQDDIAIFGFADSLGIAFPGNLVNPFEGDSGETVFRGGRHYLFTVAVVDSNYFDFVRSFSDPLTGRGFLNHLEGGLGVFGSVETRTYVLRVVAPQTDAREGTYHLAGTLDGTPVDATLELYVDELASDDDFLLFSAFVNGVWPEGTVRRSGDGQICRTARFCSTAGEFSFGFRVAGLDGPVDYQLQGVRSSDGSPFPVLVSRFDPSRPSGAAETLTLRQLP